MATAFLERFYASVRKQLCDPSSSKRLTKAEMLSEFREVEVAIWERLLSASGQESSAGLCETNITLYDDVQRYYLPGSFRQFIRFERRLTLSDPTTVADYLNSVSQYDPGPGVEILDAERGMLVHPPPTISSASGQIWTLVYQKGPIVLHYATAARAKNPHDEQVLTAYVVTTTSITKSSEFTAGLVGETVELFDASLVSLGTREILTATTDAITFAAVTGLTTACYFTLDVDWGWIVAATPSTDCGELIALPDYYNGSMLRVFSATAGAPQTVQVLDYYLDTAVWTFKVDKWPVLPTGTILYEICPALPPPYDGIYAMDVVMRNLGQRSSLRRKGAMLQERREMWNAARNYFLSNVADRAPERVIPVQVGDVDPYEDS